jgi:ATP-binding cassette, subfamily A (ABC1), member 3
MNLFRAMAVGLNIWLVSCRNYKLLTNPGDIHAYGGPIMLLAIQIIYLFPLLVWLDGQRSFSWPWRRTKQVNAEESISNNHHGIEMNTIGNEGSVSDLLCVTQVTKSFGGKLAVQNVSLAIGESSVMALLGPNGAGKTTLTNMMRGEIVLDKGRIYVQGVEVQGNLQMARKSIGGKFQSFLEHIFPSITKQHDTVCPQFDALDKITVRQQLNFYARIKGISNIKQNVELVMSKVGLTPYASRLTHVLSGGNKRKLSLAIALLGKQYFDFGPFEFVVDKYAGNPRVLILDEPSSAMDAFAKRKMWKMLSSITSGRSVLLVVSLFRSLLNSSFTVPMLTLLSFRRILWKKLMS